MNEKISMVGTGSYSMVPTKVFDQALISFSQEAIIQIVSSASYVEEFLKKGENGLLFLFPEILDFTLLSKFVKSAIESSYNSALTVKELESVELKNLEMLLSGTKLRVIQKWLQAKHDHCDANRDKPEFNPDTFYFLKELILTIEKLLLPKALDKTELALYVVIAADREEEED